MHGNSQSALPPLFVQASTEFDRGNPNSPERYYSLEIDAPTVLAISTCGSSFDTQLLLYSGFGFTNGILVRPLATNDDHREVCPDKVDVFCSAVKLTVVPGTYYVVVEGAEDFTGEYKLKISCAAALAVPAAPAPDPTRVADPACGPWGRPDLRPAGGCDRPVARPVSVVNFNALSPCCCY